MLLRVILVLFISLGFLQIVVSQRRVDSTQALAGDSVSSLSVDTVMKQTAKKLSFSLIVKNVLSRNTYLNTNARSEFAISSEKNKTGKEFQFYFIAALLLFLGLYKTAYGNYFSNIFRVFFNTSLRQNQLTDILRQSKLPSLILNVFFTIIAGFYLWLVFDEYDFINNTDNKDVLLFTILLVAIVFGLKFFVLKFTGWVTGMSTSTDIYIFIIFLINKVIGLFLIPVVILLAFSNTQYVQGIAVFSFLIIGFLFLLQLFRSYGLLQTQLKMNWFHFLLYILGFEILPYVIIFKWAATSFLSSL
ncbi:MAG: DUF4271 domain-containing protein [Ginsengibacter sp.]